VICCDARSACCCVLLQQQQLVRTTTQERCVLGDMQCFSALAVPCILRGDRPPVAAPSAASQCVSTCFAWQARFPCVLYGQCNGYSAFGSAFVRAGTRRRSHAFLVVAATAVAPPQHCCDCISPSTAHAIHFCRPLSLSHWQAGRSNQKVDSATLHTRRGTAPYLRPPSMQTRFQLSTNLIPYINYNDAPRAFDSSVSKPI